MWEGSTLIIQHNSPMWMSSGRLNRECQSNILNVHRIIPSTAGSLIIRKFALLYERIVSVSGSARSERRKSRKCLITREGGNMTAKDRRKCVRRSYQKVVDFAMRGRVYRGSIENNSKRGVFIKTGGRFSDRYEGQDISMTTEIPGRKRTGKIARVTPCGIGVQFNYIGYNW